MHRLPRLVGATLVGAVLAVLQTSLIAQSPCKLVQDINTNKLPQGSDPSRLVKCGTVWYFAASTIKHGRELWKTDGTPAGTVLVQDIRPGASDSNPGPTICVGNLMFFTADDGKSGAELWRTDGTAAGTFLLKDIQPATAKSAPWAQVSCQGLVYFTADDGKSGLELWRTDGTTAGTFLLRDINPGTAPSNPGWFECMGGSVYFSADDGSNGTELWKTNGTSAGTVRVKDINPGSPGSKPTWLKLNSTGKEIYFAADDGKNGIELWKTGGTTATTTLVADIAKGSGSSLARVLFANHNGVTLFTATATSTRELWKTDGTAQGTVLVKAIDVWALTTAGVMGKYLYFAGIDNTYGTELWRTDATTAGTTLVKDILPGKDTSNTPWSSLPTSFFVQGSTLYFAANSAVVRSGRAGDNELWKSDGTANGTVKVTDIASGSTSSYPSDLHQLGNQIVFIATTDNLRTQDLWSYGTSSGAKLVHKGPGWLTNLTSTDVAFLGTDAAVGNELLRVQNLSGTIKKSVLKDIEPAVHTSSSSPKLAGGGWGNTMLFNANNGTLGEELWKWTPKGGAELVKELQPGRGSSVLSDFVNCPRGNRPLTFFMAQRLFVSSIPTLGVTDGTTAGTRLLGVSSENLKLTCLNGKVFFAHRAGNQGIELWVSDGTVAGTKLLKDLNNNFGPGSSPHNMVSCNGKLFFAATDGIAQTELFISDGTAAGTKLLKDIATGGPFPPRSSAPANLTCCGDKVVFSASLLGFPTTADRELWISDGTAAGTKLIKDINAGSPASSNPANIVWTGKQIFFTADNGKNGAEPWVSDLTTKGTVMLKDIYAGSMSSKIGNITRCGNRIFFTANNGIHGVELWITDLTAKGTVMVKDIQFGSGSSSPANLTCCDGRLFFVADDGVAGKELWISDGTANGTMLVKDIVQGSGSSSPANFRCVGKGIYFTASKTLWFSDGTNASTKVVCQLDARQLEVCNGQLLVVGNTPQLGTELYVHSTPGATSEHLATSTEPRLTSTNPVLGSTLTIDVGPGPANHTGYLALSLPVAGPGIVPLSPWASSWINPNTFLLLAVVKPGPFSMKVPIPNNQTLNGVQASMQVWWGNNSQLPLFQPSNGVLLTVGN